MKRKKGFTLLELMVALSIFSILTLMISAILIQSQKILLRTDKRSQIQNEVRNALLKIQTESEINKDIVVSDKYGIFNNSKWELVESKSDSREILRINNIKTDVDKVYVEVYENNKHELVEFNIDKSSNTIIPDSRTTLISNIQGKEVDKIKVYSEDIFNSNGQKISELITINCLAAINENIQNESQYINSFKTKNTDIISIDLNIGNSNTGNENNGSNNGDLGNNDNSDNDSPNNPSLDGSNIEEWDSNKTYYNGDIVRYNNVIYKLAWNGNIGNNPEHGNAWTIISEEPTIWKKTKDYEGFQKVIHNNKIYISKWYVNAGLEPGVNDVWKLEN